MLSGELVKDLVLVQCRPKETIEYIRKLEAQITDNNLKLSQAIDRLEILLDKQKEIPNTFKTLKEMPLQWEWDKYTDTTTTGTITGNDLLKYTTSGT